MQYSWPKPAMSSENMLHSHRVCCSGLISRINGAGLHLELPQRWHDDVFSAWLDQLKYSHSLHPPTKTNIYIYIFIYIYIYTIYTCLYIYCWFSCTFGFLAPVLFGRPGCIYGLVVCLGAPINLSPAATGAGSVFFLFPTWSPDTLLIVLICTYMYLFVLICTYMY